MIPIILKLFGKIPKRLLIEVAALAILLFAVSHYRGQWQKERAGRIRLAANQAVLLSDLQTYQISDSLNAARVDALTMTVAEFRKGFSDMQGMLKEMSVKIKRLETVAITGTETSYYITAPVRDSIVYREATNHIHTDSLMYRETSIPIQIIQHSDRWLTLDGYIKDREFSGKIESRDTIVQIVHRVPRRFLFFRYGTKGIRQEVMSKNPHTKINYSRYIKLTK